MFIKQHSGFWEESVSHNSASQQGEAGRGSVLFNSNLQLFVLFLALFISGSVIDVILILLQKLK
jgi:hypothetical protein